MKLRIGLLATIGVALLLSGCHKQFTREHFELIQEGADTQEDVRAILGKPKVKLNDQWVYDNHKKRYSAVIHFDNEGRVVAKEWMNARTGDWEGENPATEPEFQPTPPAPGAAPVAPPPPGEVREHQRTTRQFDD